MNPASEDVKDILESESSLALIHTTNLFVGREPSTPDDCATIFDIPGYPPITTLGNDVEYYYPSIQVRVRSTSYLVGYALALDIMKLLHGRGPETWNGTTYMSILANGDPAPLGWDNDNRISFVVNFNINRR